VSKTLLNKLNGRDLINKTVCKFPTEDCYSRRCDECCNLNVSDFIIPDETDIDSKFNVGWSLWINTNNHVELQRFNGSFRQLINELNSRWPSFIHHAFITRHQREHIKNLKLISDLNTFAVVHMDFAENFSFIIQNEIQSAYWNQKQATIYTIVINVGNHHHNMVIISNRMTHDTAFVYCAQQIITTFIRQKYPSIKKINYVRYGFIFVLFSL